MVDVIVTGTVGLITTVVSSIVSWVSAKKKYNAEVDSTLIQNLQKSLEFYTTLVDDINNRLEDVLKRNEELEKKDSRLEEEVLNLRNQMFTFMQQICLDFTCSRRIKNIELFGPIKNTNYGSFTNQDSQEK